jgi:uncharacterized protein (TIGR02246 family)
MGRRAHPKEVAMKRFGTLRAAAWIGLVATAALVGPARSARAQTAKPTAQEQAAITVVKQWFAAWETGDPAKVASYMADDCEFRGIPTQPIRMGRDEFIKNTGRFIKAAPHVNVTEAVAVGGETGVAVLTKRIDQIKLNGQMRTIPLAAFFRVENGKIKEWLDMPLIPLGPVQPDEAGARQGRGRD